MDELWTWWREECERRDRTLLDRLKKLCPTMSEDDLKLTYQDLISSMPRSKFRALYYGEFQDADV